MSPDWKLLCDFGQLPSTAETRALARQVALPLAETGMLELSRSSAACGVAPLTSNTDLSSFTNFITEASGFGHGDLGMTRVLDL